MLRDFLSPHTPVPEVSRSLVLVLLLCVAALLAGCDDVGSDGTWAPFASPSASDVAEVDSAAIVSGDSAAVVSAPGDVAYAEAEVPPLSLPTTLAPADAIPALIAAAEPIAWVDRAWPAARPAAARSAVAAAEGSTEDQSAAQAAASPSANTGEEAAAQIAEAAAVLDARPKIPTDVSVMATRQDTLAENLSDDALAAYEEPVLADDTTADDTAADAASPASEPTQFSLDMVIDETRSTQGRDFYNMFYRNWQAPEGAMNYTVYVREQPGRGQGSVVEVRVNDEIAYRSQLQPRYDVIEQTAHQAVHYTRQFMQRVDVSRRIY